VIVASSIRKSEVPAFMTFTLVLAVLVGFEAIYEYHKHVNLFDTLLGHLGPFKLTAGDTTNASLIDSQGRFWLQGPTDYGAELVGILAMAMPIAVLRFLKAKTTRSRILYGVPIALLPYAMLATERKTALLAPAVAFLTIAWFRRRELLSLAPLVLVLAVGAIALSPQTLGHVVSQFTGANATKTATVDARTANYDAVRPDLWSHLLLGRGQGSYAPPNDRVVDSDIILPLVETGVLGLLTFLLIPISLIFVARKQASGRDPTYAEPALIGVSAGATLLCLACLYSFMSLPHGPDVFMYLAGLAVVAVGPDWEPRVALHTRRHRVAREDHRRVRHPTPVLEAPAQLRQGA
jgi:hypothetical protein